MGFPEHLDNVQQLKSYENYSDFIDDPNYNFELYALTHYVDFNSELKKPHFEVENFSDWITYIEMRALTSKNKVVRSRYNDLLWTYKKDYSKHILVNGNVRDKCELAITDYIELAQISILKRDTDENLFNYLTNYLFRAWLLAKQIKSEQQIKLIDLMIEIENSINTDDKIGLWGFSFKKLFLDTSIILSSKQEKAIIDRILIRVNNLDSRQYTALEYGVEMLLTYYKGNTKEQEKLLDLLEENAHVISKRPFENQTRFKKLIDICHKYQLIERKERAILNYQHYGKDHMKYLVKIEESMEITPEMKQNLIDELYHKNPINHFMQITQYFILNKLAIKNRVEENKNRFLFQSLFQKVITNEDGVTVKALSNLEDELFHESKLDWQITYPFFYIAMENFNDRHKLTTIELKDLLFDDILYKNQEKTLLSAIQAYYNKDFFAMCYISIPIIENGLRQLLFQCDHSIYEENKHDGFENITLSRILNTLDDYLSDDVIFHLKFILIEKAGLNLRNNLSHGLMSDSAITERTALTLLHILMLLKYLVGYKPYN